MKFTTEISITPSQHQIKVSDKMLLMGSCFAQEMGEWLRHRRFDVNLNPNGILFHPMVIARCLRRAIQNRLYDANECVSHDNLYHSFDFHGSFSSSTELALLEALNAQLEVTHKSIVTASTLILTWGSAWGYKWKASDEWVSNCHKIPQSNFSKELIHSDEIVPAYQNLLRELWTINPNLQVIISVSPVRYWRDGAHGNQISKAHLLLAASQLSSSDSRIHYFPAYEIMMDELRDYRFYNADMLHPSPQAVEFIVAKFQQMFFAHEANQYADQIELLLKFLGHRPLHVEDSAWKELCSEKERELIQIRQAYL
jgi:hypothetical protein